MIELTRDEFLAHLDMAKNESTDESHKINTDGQLELDL